MISKIKTFAIAAVLAITGVAFTLSPVASATSIERGLTAARPEGVSDNLMDGDDSIFTTVVNFMLFIIGAISVIMLIWGGIQYTISRGDSGAVNNAKNTILYAIVGLIVAIFAFAIVNFVVKRALGNE